MKQAFFGRPERSFVRGGTHVSVYVVPVFRGGLIVFQVAAEAARGKWLPWDVLAWGGNPYAAASELLDDWCDGAVTSLALVDAMSLPVDGGGWEIALVYRAELTRMPEGDSHRTPEVVDGAVPPALLGFDPVDLARWVRGPATEKMTACDGGLVF